MCGAAGPAAVWGRRSTLAASGGGEAECARPRSRARGGGRSAAGAGRRRIRSRSGGRPAAESGTPARRTCSRLERWWSAPFDHTRSTLSGSNSSTSRSPTRKSIADSIPSRSRYIAWPRRSRPVRCRSRRSGRRRRSGTAVAPPRRTRSTDSGTRPPAPGRRGTSRRPTARTSPGRGRPALRCR